SGPRANSRIEMVDGLWMVEADEGQIGQVLQNIIINADQAMTGGGTIFITAENVHQAGRELLDQGSYVKIAIQDNGVGIPAEHLAKIFDPYFTTKNTGSGLGLATAYAIIKHHGGMIDVQSALGKGSTFAIYLPAFETETLKTQPVVEAEKVMRKGRILVMDDDPMVRDIAASMIGMLGHEVEVAVHGDETIAKYAAALSSDKPFDVVILDLTVRGGMGGEEAIQKLLLVDPNICAIVSSGYAESTVVAEYQAFGFKARLAKPYKFDDLQDSLNALLGQ
ncbi:MAG: ATP-binding protein, partial [Syntrophales bacterium LBB04]|nr:ATP-binding protein [Syntrophales bacterium LBB04]